MPKEVRCSFPWILWMLWKNKNAFIFEGKEYVAEETVAKCLEESRRCHEMVNVSKENVGDKTQRHKEGTVCRAPESGRVKCNIGIS